jgi:hypothetical protein
MNTTYNEFLVETPHDIWIEKVGYDSINKKMIAKVYTSLFYILEHSTQKPSWTAVVKHMLTMEERDIASVAIGGYYSTIRKNLKDIGVIRYNGRKGLEKGDNWKRFYSDEDWSWFITNTNSGGVGTIIK